jgi:ankyrin repeat protein
MDPFPNIVYTVKSVKNLIESNPRCDINKKYGPDDETLLHIMATNDELDIVIWLVSNGADVNILDKRKRAPIINAARRSNNHIVKYLVEHSSDINARSESGGTALHFACMHDNIGMVKYLLDHGIDKECMNYHGLRAVDLIKDLDTGSIGNIDEMCEYIESFELVPTKGVHYEN